MFVPGHFNFAFPEYGPTQIAADAQGNVYVPDSYFGLVYRFSPTSSQPVIFAGTYFSFGPNGDGGPAASATLFLPEGVALDKAGNVYIADSGHNQIRRVDAATGIITTVANISQPRSVAVDAAGNIYVTSTAPLTVVYKIAAGSAVVTTFAGTGASGYTGDGGPATQATLGAALCVALDLKGDFYIADGLYHVVRKIDLTTSVITTVVGTGTAGYIGDGSVATAAELNGPDQITFDAAGDLYISDNGNNVIRRVSAFDHVISTIVGGGSLLQNGFASASGSALDVGMFGGGGLALDAGGNLWINGHYGTQMVTAMAEPALFQATVTGQTTLPHSYTLTNTSASPLTIQTVQLSGANAGDFAQRNNCPAQLQPGASCAISVSFTPTTAGTRAATVEVTDNAIGSPHQISLTGIGIGPGPTTFTFQPAPTNSSVTQPVSVAVPPSAGTSLTASLAFGTDFSVSGLTCSNNCSVDVSFRPQFPGLRRDALQLKDGSGHVVATQFLSGIGQGSRIIYRPGSQFSSTTYGAYNKRGAAMDPGGTIYVSDYNANAVFRWDNSNHLLIPIAGDPGDAFGGYAGDGGPAISARLHAPFGLATDPAGNLYICDLSNHVVRRVDRMFGTISTVAGTGVAGSSGDGGPATAARLNSPSELTVDSFGNLFISDWDSHVVRRVDGQTGTISTVAGTGTAGYAGDGGPAASALLNAPRGLAIGLDGNLYIADSLNHVVRMVDLSTGVISTIAGTGVPGSAGDGGPANAAQLDTPSNLLFDAAGSLYVSSYGGPIREITPARERILPVPTPTYISSGPLLMDGDGTLYVITGGILTCMPSADPLTFPLTLLGTSASTQNVTIENIGSTPVDPNFISLTGINAGEFSQSNPCPSGLAPGARCTITVGFQPTHSGALTAAISAGNAPPLTLNGTGGIGVATATVSTFSFGTAVLSTPTLTKYIPITNTGNAPLTVTGITITGPNASDFTLNDTLNSLDLSANCQQPLTPNGYCYITIQFTPSGIGMRNATLTITDSGLPSSLTVALSGSGLQPISLTFVPVKPCRIVDTRIASSYGPAAALEGGSARSFDVSQSNCAIPPDIAAVALNVTAVPLEPLGYVTVWPAGTSMPVVSTLNSVEGTAKANAAIVPVSNGSVDVFVSDRSHIILDATGYFVPAAANGLQFYPLPPCRVTDTRDAPGVLGGPFLPGGSVRTLPILQSACRIPSAAQVYSFNITVVPKGKLDYLTVWPSGQTRPGVSTLNAPLGTVTANAAITPAGSSGSIDVFATQDTDLVVDINGYFAPPSTDGLNFYSLPPCRILDTRLPPGFGVLSGQNFVNVAGICIAPTTAKSYVLNATLVTAGPVGYLTLWSDYAAQPNVSTTNAAGPTVVADMAIVPTNTGNIQAFLSNPAHLILDMAGYFAP